MARRLGRMILVGVWGIGFPLSQLAILRLGRCGAVAVEGVAVGLLVRDARLLRSGARPGQRRASRVLLLLEVGAAAVASVFGVRPAIDGDARRRALDQRPVGPEIGRRIGIGMLFGIHSWRSWVAR